MRSIRGKSLDDLKAKKTEILENAKRELKEGQCCPLRMDNIGCLKDLLPRKIYRPMNVAGHFGILVETVLNKEMIELKDKSYDNYPKEYEEFIKDDQELNREFIKAMEPYIFDEENLSEETNII